MIKKIFFISISFLLGIAGSCIAMEKTIDLHKAIEGKISDHNMTSHSTSPSIAVHTFNTMHKCASEGDNGFGFIETQPIYQNRVLTKISPGSAQTLLSSGLPSVILGQELSLSDNTLMPKIVAAMDACLSGRKIGYNASANLTSSKDQCLVTFWLNDEFEQLSAPIYTSAFTQKAGPINKTLYLDRIQYTYLKSKKTEEQFAIMNAHLLYQNPQLCRSDSFYIQEIAGLIEQESIALSALGFRPIFGGDLNLSPSLIQKYLSKSFDITVGIMGSSLSYKRTSKTASPQENDLIAVYKGNVSEIAVSLNNGLDIQTSRAAPMIPRLDQEAQQPEIHHLLSMVSPELQGRVKATYDEGQFGIECLQVLASFPVSNQANKYDELFEIYMLNSDDNVKLREALGRILFNTNGGIANNYQGFASSTPTPYPLSSSMNVHTYAPEYSPFPQGQYILPPVPQMHTYAPGYPPFPQGQQILPPVYQMPSYAPGYPPFPQGQYILQPAPQMPTYAPGYPPFPQGQQILAPVHQMPNISWGRFSSFEDCLLRGITGSIQPYVEQAYRSGEITMESILQLSKVDFRLQKGTWENMCKSWRE